MIDARRPRAGRLGRKARPRCALLACATMVALGPATAAAQRPTGAQVEWRVDAIAARTSALQLGLGVNGTAGLYTRLAAVVGAGVAASGGRAVATARADATARFHFDPFREVARAVYGLGGATLLYDEEERWRPRLHIGVGVEGPVRRGRIVAAEVALGGGVRLGVAVRRARGIGR